MSEQRANPHIGEVEIDLQAPEGTLRTFVLRPTFEAMVEIEANTGQSLVMLARRLSSGELGINESTHIITACLKAAGAPASYTVTGAMIYNTGLVHVLPALGDLLVSALSGGAPPGEPKQTGGN